MKQKLNMLVLIFIGLTIAACAQMPKQSIELSATVGRDVAEMHRAHRELGILLFDRMISDVNRFVDDVYAPYQIEQTLKVYQSDLADAITKASQPDPTGEAQKNAYGLFKVYFEELRNDIESYREELLMPIKRDRDEFLAKLDTSYEQIHYANSIVTGHLSSIAKVYDTQDELLAKAGLEDFRQESSKRLVEMSNQVAGFVDKAQKGNEKIDEAAEKLKEIISKYNEIKDKLTNHN